MKAAYGAKAEASAKTLAARPLRALRGTTKHVRSELSGEEGKRQLTLLSASGVSESNQVEGAQ